jgi:hypothetical protein
MSTTAWAASAPYWLNGHQNIGGQAIAKEINDDLAAAGETSFESVDSAIEVLGDLAALYKIEAYAYFPELEEA